VSSTLSVLDHVFNATKSPRRSAGFIHRTTYLGTVVVVPVVVLGVAVVVVHGVVPLLIPVVEEVSLVVVPLMVGVFAAEVVVPLLLQSIEVGLLVVPVVGVALVVPVVVEVVEALLPSLGVVPIEEPEFCWLLGVVPAVAPMPEVEVLGLVCGVATLPAGVVVLVLCPVVVGVVLELLMFPVACEFAVCPTPAGIEAVLPIVLWPVAVVPVVVAPAVPAVVPAPAVLAVCAPAKAVQQSASVAVIRIFRMNCISSMTVCTVAYEGLDERGFVSEGQMQGSGSKILS
jgi:hypothetical protein